VGSCVVDVNFGQAPFKFHPNDSSARGAATAVGAGADEEKCVTPTAASSAAGASGGAASNDASLISANNLLQGHSSDDVYCPLECSGLQGVSHLEKLDVSYALLQSLAERKSGLDVETVRAAVDAEIELLQSDANLQFTYVGSDVPELPSFASGFGSFSRPTPASLLNDPPANQPQGQPGVHFSRSSNLHLTFGLAGDSADTDAGATAAGENKKDSASAAAAAASSSSASAADAPSDASGDDAHLRSRFVLKSVMIRAFTQPGASLVRPVGAGAADAAACPNAVFGLVFVSDTKVVDYEQFEYANGWRLPQYRRFVQRKQAAAAEAEARGESGEVTYAPHEPIGFIVNVPGSQTVHFHVDPSVSVPPARFVTLKLSNVSSSQPFIYLQHIKIGGVLASNPLATVQGAKREEKIQQLREQLMAGAMERAEGASSSLSPQSASASASAAAASSSSASLSPTSSSSASASGTTWTLAMDEALVSVLQSVASRAGVSPASLEVGALRPTPTDLSRFHCLANVTLASMRSRVAILKFANKVAAPLLGYSHATETRPAYRGDSGSGESSTASAGRSGSSGNSNSASGSTFSTVVYTAGGKGNPSTGASDSSASSLSSTVRALKGLYFLSTKKAVFDSFLLQNQSTRGAPSSFGMGLNAPPQYMAPRITINRIRAARLREEGTSAALQGSVFAQLYQQMRAYPIGNFRNLAVDQQVWNVQFQGEGSIDVGGPFRESLAALAADLMSTQTNLFLLSPNGVSSVGLNRSSYVPNPSASSTQQLAQFEWLGALFGVALRTKLPLALDLPSTVWKSLLGAPLDVSDLEAFDKLCVQALSEISKLDSRAYASMFAEQRWVTQLSDHTELELKRGGRDLLVPYEQREEFIRLSINARLQESSKQLAALRKGLSAVVPTHMLALFTWRDLELQVCGDPHIDIAVLKRHTVYSRGLSASDDVCVWLFKALHSFTADERQLFLRFVWGRNRLPATESDWGASFTINSLSTAQDESLPVSHTCFFSIDLPAYTSYDTLRKKLLYAILNCQAIDVDFNSANADANAWAD